MKGIINELLIGLLIITFSCKQTADNSVQSDGNLPDSVRLAKALEKAEQLANTKIDLKVFRDTFETASDSSFILITTLTIDSFFNQKLLRVYRETPSVVYNDLYFKKENEFTKVLTVETGPMTYVKDTVLDVNGDNREDYLINWYGSSGCCLKNFYDVFLLRDDDTFSDKYTFVNPTFSPTEKVIRGVSYGHPGQTELYKYKWSNFEVDTVEYIYPYQNEKGEYLKGEYVKSRYVSWDKRYKREKSVKLKSVPNEYIDIYGYDWFMGFEDQ